jgi:glycosyltransferase involved in cell wall biosynthesis
MKNMRTEESSFSSTETHAFDFLFYATRYPDLTAAGLTSEVDLKMHYERSGKREKRTPNVHSFAMQLNLPPTTIKPELPWLHVLGNNDIDQMSDGTVFDLLAALPPIGETLDMHEHNRLRHIDTITFLASYLYRSGKETEASLLFDIGIKKLNELETYDWSRALALCVAIGYDDEVYRHQSKDLIKAGLTTAEERLSHFIRHGFRERRCYTLPAWLKMHKLPVDLLNATGSLEAAIARTTERGYPVSLGDALETLRGHRNAGRVWFSDSAKVNAGLYVIAGKALLADTPGDEECERAQRLFQIACTFDACNAEALFQLGNLHAQRTERREAATFFSRALDCGGDPAKIVPHLVWMYRALQNIDAAYETLVTHLPQLRGKRDVTDQISDFCQEIWSEAEKHSAADVFQDRREAMVEVTVRAVERQHQLWTLALGATETFPKLGALRTDRVLIVGDRFLPQCERYRIIQKVEQLETAGMCVTVVSWTEIQTHMSELALHDIIIFYRVPALPRVVQAIAQVNASGRLAIYEIDDLIFDPIYPPAIDTYGGAVGVPQYIGLVRGMALFHAAARLCRVGIASTKPLQKWLAGLVAEKRCLLHRNGLDSQFGTPTQAEPPGGNDKINLFYGSGTLAHNNDFCDLALPAIYDIMDRDMRVQLVIAGYLELPCSFLDRFKDRILRLPPTKNIATYYGYLSLADINLATLVPDTITDCKSELKWFEAAFFNKPSIVSGTQNYVDVVRDGVDGLIAHTSNDWKRFLTALINDRDLRQKIGRTANERVLQEYSIEILGSSLRASIKEEVRRLSPMTMTKPKIAMVNVYYAPQSIGGATRVFEGNISAYREKHGDAFEFVVFTSGMGEGVPHEVRVDSDNGMRVYRANVLFRENMDWLPQDQRMGEIFKRFLEVEQPDMVHFHCVQRLTGSIVETTRNMGIPYIVTMHDAWWFSDLQFLVDAGGMVYPEGHPGNSRITETHPPANATVEQSLARRFYLHSLLKGASRVITVSESFAKICRLNGYPEVEVCRNGIDASVSWESKDTSYTGRVVCGQIGSMSSHKGYNLLRATVMALQPRNLEFLIVDHSKSPDWIKHATWGNVPVTFIGRQQQKTIASLYGRIDVLMAPSIWPESFGLVTREAAQCGCWVVASDIGGIGEDVQHAVNGFVIPPNEEALSEVIQTLDADPARYKGLAPSSPGRTDREQAEEMISFYQAVLSESSHH